MSEELTGTDVKVECVRHGVTQVELAEALGVTASQLSGVFTGGIVASQEYLQRCIDKVREIAKNRTQQPSQPAQ